MGENNQVRSAVSKILEEAKAPNVSENTLEQIVKALYEIKDPNAVDVILRVAPFLGLTFITLKNSVDFGEADYWMKQLIEILKKRK
ncbi:hypothetical protein EZ428_02730 [Pedobacter frigiditerrae]|uniref:Uncharacterized protein n=1 Tax=Pedobacter frigiditerrae TaxID=2530452 RepID=A0A4R0N2Z8_9SPHI|nr:hypothetical protein [Pedobacter frigiditerrae]TCC93703.1 hypothetical protein EZ428_02730 [Pedobacter frigiditerrae]